jgi:hypothetical protein
VKKILIVSLSNVSSDPRILRQVETLKSNYEVDVAGFGSPIDEIHSFFEITENSFGYSMAKRKLFKLFYLLSRSYKLLYFFDSRTRIASASQMSEIRYDLILANDFDSLPLIKCLMNQETRILLDAHEYYFDEINSPIRSKLLRPYRKWVAGDNFDRVVAISTVSEGIAKLYILT